MGHADGQGGRASMSRRAVALALLAVATAGGLGVFWAARKGRGDRPGLASRYRNVGAEVRYVGDDACVRCHAGIAATYRNHPMGRSLIPIAVAPAEFRGGAEAQPLFEANGFTYAMENRGGRTIHKETRRDRGGRVIGEVEGEVKYVLGSGTRALAFLIGRDDYLFESPITWYSQKRAWGHSPGYGVNDRHFERQITPGCLTCHANAADHVEGSEGRYRPPTFRGHAIGCERCHGPGELHVREPLDKSGPNIVNPRDLAPALREDVCQQCHLLGGTTIAKFGRDITEYRPGLPLREFVTVFVRPPGAPGEHANGDHVEQMVQSRCFRASRGALGCISCHDPHALPPAETKVAYYRDRCLECHTKRGCALPIESRRAKSPDDSCVACHMPRAATSDIPHVATTLHSIPRVADAPDSPQGRPDETVLVPFHRNQMSPEELAESDRDLGVALRHRGERGAARAVPLLRKALAKRPDDVLARESEGFALGGLGRGEEALAAFESVLERDPNRESSLEGAALIAADLGRRDRSIALWRRAIAADPWRSDFHDALARQLVLDERWPEAAEAAKRALRLNPASPRARVTLVVATLRMGSAEEARSQFDTLLEFADPAAREGLVRWFDSLR